jgi:hypothetical protein
METGSNTTTVSSTTLTKYLIILLSGLFLASCGSIAGNTGSIPERAQKKIVMHDLYKTMIKIDIHATLADASYDAVDMNWLKTTFNSKFNEINAKTYSTKNEYDCDDFARLYCSLAQVYSRNNIAIGEFWYKPTNSKQVHAVVIAYSEKGLHFIEPQNGWEIELSEEEVYSCSFLRM